MHLHDKVLGTSWTTNRVRHILGIDKVLQYTMCATFNCALAFNLKLPYKSKLALQIGISVQLEGSPCATFYFIRDTHSLPDSTEFLCNVFSVLAENLISVAFDP